MPASGTAAASANVRLAGFRARLRAGAANELRQGTVGEPVDLVTCRHALDTAANRFDDPREVTTHDPLRSPEAADAGRMSTGSPQMRCQS